MCENLKFVLAMVENIEGKQENAGYQHFLLFQHFFPKGSFLEVVKSLDCVVKGYQSQCRVKGKVYLHSAFSKFEQFVNSQGSTRQLDTGISFPHSTEIHKIQPKSHFRLKFHRLNFRYSWVFSVKYSPKYSKLC